MNRVHLGSFQVSKDTPAGVCELVDATITITFEKEQRTGMGNLTKTFRFTPDGHSKRYQKWGSFTANFWFTTRIGKTKRLTTSYAVSGLHGHVSNVGGAYKISYEMQEAKC